MLNEKRSWSAAFDEEVVAYQEGDSIHLVDTAPPKPAPRSQQLRTKLALLQRSQLVEIIVAAAQRDPQVQQQVELLYFTDQSVAPDPIPEFGRVSPAHPLLPPETGHASAAAATASNRSHPPPALHDDS